MIFKRLHFSLLLLLSFGLISSLFAQNKHKIDSLQNEIKKQENIRLKNGNKELTLADSVTAKILVKISQMYWGNDPDKAMENAQKGLALSLKIGFKKGVSNAYNSIGVINEDKGDYAVALAYYNKSLDISVETNDQKGIAAGYGNIGNIFYQQANYPKAISKYMEALKIYEQLGDKVSIAFQYFNIGSIYLVEGKYAEAYSNFLNSLKMCEKIGDKTGMADSYLNIGNVFIYQQKYNDALLNYNQALQIYTQMDDKQSISSVNNSIGSVYFEQSNFSEALKYFTRCLKNYEETGNKRGISLSYFNIGRSYCSLNNFDLAAVNINNSIKIREEIGDKHGMVESYNFLGQINKLKGNYKEAITNVNKALNIGKEIGSKELIKNSYGHLFNISAKMGNYRDAFDYQTKYHIINDSIFNDKNNTKFMELKMNDEFERKETLVKAEQEKKDTLAIAEIIKQKNLRNSLFVGFALMIVLAMVSFRSFRRKQKDNKIITKQKEAVEHQKELVEYKNKEITKSIEYALRIQTAILPPARIIRQTFKDSFILYKPKDIVAGDFYWMETVQLADNSISLLADETSRNPNSSSHQLINTSANQLILFAACDCTGHGVPGAMVSVVCHNALNRAVREFGLTKPSEILDKTAEIVIENFSKSEDEIKDGMDISLISIRVNADTNTTELQYAGANNALWIIKNGELTEVKADKQPIGRYENSEPFTNHSFTLSSGDNVYLFTDGFADQFGGGAAKQKKLTRKRFKDLVLSLQEKRMYQQGEDLDKFFSEYRNEVEQIDDILVVGIRL